MPICVHRWKPERKPVLHACFWIVAVRAAVLRCLLQSRFCLAAWRVLSRTAVSPTFSCLA